MGGVTDRWEGSGCEPVCFSTWLLRHACNAGNRAGCNIDDDAKLAPNSNDVSGLREVVLTLAIQEQVIAFSRVVTTNDPTTPTTTLVGD